MASRYFGNQTARRPHLVKAGGGLSGEVSDLRSDVEEAFLAFEASSVAQLASSITPIQALDADGIMTAQASAAVPQVFTHTNFDGILNPSTAGAIIKCPKRITIVIAGVTPAQYLGGNVTLVGTDADGKAQTEVVVTAAGAGTTTSTKAFATLTSASFPASSGVAATIGLGVAAEIGCIATSPTSLSAVDINTDAEFNRTRIGNRAMLVARAVVLNLSNSADFGPGTLTVDGFDINGDPISEALTVPDNGNTDVNGTKFFAQITRARMSAMQGTGGVWSLGIRDTILGLPRPMANGLIAAVSLKELARADTATAWSVPAAGAVTAPASALPNGSYTPNAAVVPDGARGHVFVYVPA